MKLIFQIALCVLITFGKISAQDVGFKKKYINHTEFGGLFGRVQYGNNSMSGQEAMENRLSLTAQMFNGIKLTDQLATGVTVGMDWYKTALINPIAAGVRYDLTNGRVARLFSTLDAGYGFAWFHDDLNGYKTKGGFMINPGMGLKYGKPGGTAVTIAVTYKRQHAEINKPPLWEQTERVENRIYNRMGLRLGFSF